MNCTGISLSSSSSILDSVCRFSFILGKYTTSRCVPLTVIDVEKTYPSFAYFSGITHIQICCLFIHWVVYLLIEFNKSLYILDVFNEVYFSKRIFFILRILLWGYCIK